MPLPQPRRPGAPIWIELDSPDPARAADFYRGLLGVRVSEPNDEYGGLRSIDHEHGSVAAMMPAEPGAGGWVVHLHAPDLDGTARRVTDAGGTVTHPPSAVGGAGRLAVVRDPSGAEVGLWEPGAQYGTQVEGEPGTPVWNELGATSRYRETVRFYEEALDWRTAVLADDDDFRMVTDGEGADAVAGIYLSESSGPSRWYVVFGTDDVDAAADHVTAHGGTIQSPPADTPYGRFCRAADPDGSVFALMRPAAWPG